MNTSTASLKMRPRGHYLEFSIAHLHPNQTTLRQQFDYFAAYHEECDALDPESCESKEENTVSK